MRKAVALVAVALAAVAAYAGITRAAGSGKQAVSSERVSLTVTASGAQLQEPVTVRADGTVDNNRRVAAFSIDLGGAQGAFPMRLPVSRLDEVLDASNGGVVSYVQVPGIARYFTQGKSWLKIDMGQVAKGLGLELEPFTNLATAPTEVLPTLRSVSSGEQVLGSETIDGVATTHSRLTLDVRRLSTLAPSEHRALVAAALDELVRHSGIATQPVEVWTDADGLLRRATATVNARDGQAKLDLRLSDFGSPVDVEVPAAKDTLDATGWLAHH
jgi:hypothetical protein